MLYDKNMICSSKTINNQSGSNFIATTFNEGHRKVVHVITLYRSRATLILLFMNILKQWQTVGAFAIRKTDNI